MSDPFEILPVEGFAIVKADNRIDIKQLLWSDPGDVFLKGTRAIRVTIAPSSGHAPIDWEGLRRREDLPEFLGPYHDRINIELVGNKWWNTCLDYLRERIEGKAP